MTGSLTLRGTLRGCGSLADFVAVTLLARSRYLVLSPRVARSLILVLSI
jgi:hypothetical protein